MGLLDVSEGEIKLNNNIDLSKIKLNGIKKLGLYHKISILRMTQ